MKLRIHRGAREIGGSCVELESTGERIILDLGLPLNSPDLASAPLPAVSGLIEQDPRLKAVVISHGHRDHWGLLPKVRPDIPIVMGRAAASIMRAAADFTPDGFAPRVSEFLENQIPLTIGRFSITPLLVDHSGFDAYALVVEADGRRLFYSGDLRAHGRKDKLFEALIHRPPQRINVMLMEGSSLGRIDDNHKFATEAETESTFVEKFRMCPGMALVACSAQNIDRVVTVYRAAKKAGRTLVIDAYAAEVLKATGNQNIPKPVRGWSNLAVYIPQRQRVFLKEKGIGSLVDSYRQFRFWPEQLSDVASKTVMLFRPWMLRDRAVAQSLEGASVFWSQWDGYLSNGQGAALKAECAQRSIPFEVIHTSGHASPVDLKRLAKAIAPDRLIPIHTFARGRFPDLFDNVCLVDDGQWLEI